MSQTRWTAWHYRRNVPCRQEFLTFPGTPTFSSVPTKQSQEFKAGEYGGGSPCLFLYGS